MSLPSKHVCRCPGESHPTFGACVRSKGLRIGYCRSHVGWDTTREKNHDKELELYRQARSEGIQPDGTYRRQVENAMKASDMVGEAYGAHP